MNKLHKVGDIIVRWSNSSGNNTYEEFDTNNLNFIRKENRDDLSSLDAVPISTNKPIENLDISSDFINPAFESENSVFKVTCNVCQEEIIIDSEIEQDLVKCNNCNEITATRSASAGKKYVRCLCNCLLICNSSSKLIACPREHCKRIFDLNLEPSSDVSLRSWVPGMCLVTCGHCKELFRFNMLQKILIICPHCKKVSSVGSELTKEKSLLYFVIAMLLFIVSIVVTYFKYSYVSNENIYVFGHIAILTLTVLAFWKFIYYFQMKDVSNDD